MATPGLRAQLLRDGAQALEWDCDAFERLKWAHCGFVRQPWSPAIKGPWVQECPERVTWYKENVINKCRDCSWLYSDQAELAGRARSKFKAGPRIIIGPMMKVE